MNEKADKLILAANAFSARNYRAASRLLREELNVRGNEAEILWWLAQTEFAVSITEPTTNDESGQEAIFLIKQAISLQPNDARYYYSLGDMYTHVVPPDYINATSAYRKSLEFAPNFYPALGALAMLYGVPENVISLSEAISFCEKALSINPSKSLWLTLSRLYEISNKESCAYNAQLNSKFELYDNTSIQY